MNSKSQSSGFARVAKLAALAVLTLVGTQAMGCLSRPVEPLEPRTTSTVVERLTQSAVDKIDLLLMLDNSRSMADKQQILALAVPDLVTGLVNPRCQDDSGHYLPPSQQPTDPLADCPAGSKREFTPVTNIHVGVVTSSLGGHGSDACPESQPTNDDHGELVYRKDAMSQNGTVPTYQNKGFLAWDPKQKLMPPGIKDIMTIVANMKDLVVGVDQVGCGFESQLEGWYRFLVDPEPYQTITLDSGGYIKPMGIDTKLIQERTDFLRPDSLLSVIMLSDENDCSVKEYGQLWIVNQLQDFKNTKNKYHLPPPRSECATNPNDACCLSCQQPQGSCPPDPACNTPLDDTTDNQNLRCWDNKRRFGIDFLYPIDRYTQGLQSAQIANRAGELVPNPIYTDLDPTDMDTTVRTPDLVFMAGIVGVPWQDIARDPNDLTKGFKNSDELLKPDMNGNNTWAIILGDPSMYVPPLDPLMVESNAPRMGTNPVLNVPLGAAGAGTPNSNPINGKEWDIVDHDDLEYACIFDLPMSRKCNTPGVACDCDNTKATMMPPDSPLCNGDTQTKAKGYPGTRELSAIKSIGSQGIVGSICPKQVSDANAADFGYRPAIGAIIDRLKVALGGKCLPRQLSPDKNGDVPCLIIEARNTMGQCDGCKSNARQPISQEHQAAVKAAQQDPIAAQAGWDCFCEITQLQGEDLKDCQDQTQDPPVNPQTMMNVNGWCYIDATTVPPTGNVDLVKNCPQTEKRLVRFVGEGNPKPGATLFITCSGE